MHTSSLDVAFVEPQLAQNQAVNQRVEDLAREFRACGRVQIPGFLEEGSASAIHNCLAEQEDWNRVFLVDDEHFDTDASAVDDWPDKKRADLQALIHKEAQTKFQYCYDNLPIYDIYHKSLMPGHFIHAVFEYLNSDDFLDLMRNVTRDESIAFADAMATRFQPGHFLTRHNDNVEGKRRRVAYVLNLSRDWNPDWGGILQFFDKQDNVHCGYAPSFNTLNLLRVPTVHSVGIVAPFAASDRLSITGWLRSGRDPMAA